MKFNKKQKQIVAYCLALLESECTNKSTKKEMHKILSELQKEKIFGTIKF
tara:strand:+ start:379 stop:528 length:150 start_codon:yes stop_codon:yes gene_type:complete